MPSAHGNRGRKPHNALTVSLRRPILELAQSSYAGGNTQHFAELLADREGMAVSRSSAGRILLEVGIKSWRKRRPSRYHSRSKHYPKKGMLLQTDDSHDDWLQGRRPWPSLIAAVDNATGNVPYAVFRQQEMLRAIFSCCIKL